MEKPTILEGGCQGRWCREGVDALIREKVRELIEEILDEEIEEALGAGRSAREPERQGYRHGSKRRRLTLGAGTVDLTVPRARLVDRHGELEEWRSGLLPRYRRSSPEVEQAVLGMYLSGGNTRRIRGALKPLLSGAPLSKSSVSRLVSRLEESYEQWRQRDLGEERILYLYLDAIYPKVRSGGKVVSLPVLVALGVKASGEKILLALASGGAETTASWQMLLEELVARQVGRPQLVISDGNPGLKSAVERIWSGLRHQRCTVHKLRNLLAKAPKHLQETLHEDYNRIVYAATEPLARKARESFLSKWRKLCPAVAASLEEVGEELLTFYRFPESQWKSLRTTNAIERLQEEFRRRVKTQASLPSEKAVLLIFFGLFASRQVNLRRISGWMDLAMARAAAA